MVTPGRFPRRALSLRVRTPPPSPFRSPFPLPLSPFPVNTQPTYTHRRAKAIWDFEGIYCTSRHIPHVKFAGLIHPGILGCAPSREVLAEWNRREGELIAANPLAERDVALP